MKRYASILLSTTLFLSASAASPLASGHWVKFRVTESGAYQFTEAELRDLGFSDPAKVRVYGFAPTLLLTHDTGKIPADLSTIPTVYENGKIAFYAKDNVDYNAEFWSTGATPDGLNHNRLATTNGATYFLSDQGEAPALPQIQAAQPTGQELTSHDCVIFHEQDLTNPGSAGVVFGGELLSSRSAQVPFTVTLADLASGTGRMLHQSLMLNSSSSNNNLTVLYPEGWTSEDTGSNGTGQNINTINPNHVVFGLSRRHQNLTIPVKEEPTDYELIFTPNPAIGSGFSRGYIDYWALIYDRQNNLAGQSQLTMHFPKSSSLGFALSGMDGEGWHVWDVTSPSEIKECVLTETESGTYVGKYVLGTSTAPAAVVAFNTAATLLSPEIIGPVANQDLHSLATPDMVIVTSAMLMNAAEEAAQVHRTLQGLEVAVVNQEDIFNEFGSGNVSPEAVRLFLRHLWLQDPDKLKSVMLVGPATVDNARNVNPGSPSVVTFQQESQKQCEKTTTNFFSDTFFGHLDDLKATTTDKPMFRLLKTPQTIAVGRLPWSNPTTISGYMAKVEDYLKNPPVVPAIGNIITSSDLTKSASDDHHYSDAENTIAPYGDKLDGDVTVTRLHSNFYSAANNDMTRRWLKSMLTRGAEMMVFFGHGMSTAISGSNSSTNFLLDLNNSKELNNSGNHTFGFFGSCNIAEYDSKTETLATELVGNPNGGLIGLVACCREGFVSENPKVGKAFIQAFVSAGDGTYIGDAFKSALDSFDASSSIDYFCNYNCYGLTGDPALPIYRTTHSMVLDPIEAILPGVANTITGSITDADGNIDEDFNGTVQLTIYDAPLSVSNKVSTDTKLAAMTLDHNPLVQVPAEVSNGRFTSTFNGPGFSDNYSDETGIRITAYAYSEDKRSRALASAKGVSVAAAPEDATPIIYGAPTEITDFYAQDSEIDASLAGRVLLHASISAPDGLNIGTAGFSPARLSIDGKSKTDATRAIRFLATGVYVLDYLASEMGDGRHTAQLDIVGLDGEVVSRTIEFSTNSVAAAEAEVTASEDGEVKVEFSVSNIDKSFVCVETLSGQMVKRIETTEHSVNITDLPSGVYRIYTQHESKSTHTSSPKTIVTI